MAIQVSGTEVISNARALNNIASVDATTAASIITAGVGGGSITLLGTLTTTSGTTQTLSGLTLTSYKQVMAVVKYVSSNTAGTTELKLNSVNGFTNSISIGVNTAGTNEWNGYATIDLASGNVWAVIGYFPAGTTSGSGATQSKSGVQSTVTTASTSITFAVGTDSFDSGTITVYGVQ
jgi:hypothetical protein